jgi:hypothetical protein
MACMHVIGLERGSFLPSERNGRKKINAVLRHHEMRMNEKHFMALKPINYIVVAEGIIARNP